MQPNGDLLGHGVNVAARIESLCEPGGVWLSRSVYNQVKGKFNLALIPSGLHQVKNISEAVETFRVALDGVAPVTLMARIPHVLVTHRNGPAKSFAGAAWAVAVAVLTLVTLELVRDGASREVQVALGAA